MNSLATRDVRNAGDLVVAPTQEPRLSPSLRAEVERMLDPSDPSQGRYVTVRDQREASEQAVAFDAILAPVASRHLLEWLVSINRAVRNPQDRDAFQQRAQAFEMDLGHLSSGCFTGETRRDLLKASDGFFPSVGQALNLLEPIYRTWKRRQSALLRVANSPSVNGTGDTSAPLPPDEEVRAQVAEQVAQLKRHVAAEEARREPPRLTAKARPLAPQHLIAAYEALARDPDPKVAAPAIHRLNSLRATVQA